MKINELNPHIRYARIHSIPQISPDYSRCYDCRLFYFSKADGEFCIDEEKYKISNNCAIFLPPASKYRLNFPSFTKYEALVFNFDLFQTHSHIKESLRTATEKDFDEKKITLYELPKEFSSPIVRETDVGADLLFQCIDEFVTQRNLYRESASALLKFFLVGLLREKTAHGSSKLVSGIIDYIKQNHGNPSLTNTEIAEAFGYHPYHLSRLMKEATGMSLKQYILYYRIQSAKDLLINSEASIDEIAWRSGFGVSAYFIKRFKESLGVTPLNYRKSKLGMSL